MPVKCRSRADTPFSYAAKSFSIQKKHRLNEQRAREKRHKAYCRHLSGERMKGTGLKAELYRYTSSWDRGMLGLDRVHSMVVSLQATNGGWRCFARWSELGRAILESSVALLPWSSPRKIGASIIKLAWWLSRRSRRDYFLVITMFRPELGRPTQSKQRDKQYIDERMPYYSRKMMQ